MLESDRSHAAIRITYIGLVINIVLTAGKLIAGIVGSSSAMVADSVHSLSDFATDIVVIVSFLFGAAIFHEHNLKAKALDLALVLMGMVFLYIGSK